MALISVVTATYNRANVLRLTIDSLCAQTLADWELIVVGDACTDDTADVVASFADPRMRFVNLPRNSGDQAVPNNEGVRLATGRYLAFLNHDDLWTRDHLATALAALEESQADLVFTLILAIDAADVPHLLGACPSGTYEPRAVVPASSWLLRREVAESVGPWRRANEIFASPSQDWLFRAWKQRRKLVPVAKATVIALQSGQRRNSYAHRQIEENQRYATLLRDDPELIARLLTAIALRLSREADEPSRIAGRAVRNALVRASVGMGVHPATLFHAIRYRRRGGFIDMLRHTRGLPPLPKRKEQRERDHE
jgi:glycosyltransferase involved in cell wall biosynthesis